MPDLNQFNEILHGPQYTSFSSGIAENLSCMHDMPLELKGHEGDIAKALDMSIAALIIEKYEPQRRIGVNTLKSRWPNYGKYDTYWPEMSGKETIKLEILEILKLFLVFLSRQMVISIVSRDKILLILSNILHDLNSMVGTQNRYILALRNIFNEEISRFPEGPLFLEPPDDMSCLPISFIVHVEGNTPLSAEEWAALNAPDTETDWYKPDSHDFSDLGCY